MGAVLPNSVFFHIPKTGGSWVDESLKRAFGKRYIKMNLEVGFHADINGIHIPKSKVEVRHFSFAFVRHPLDWYRSYWKFNYDKFERDKDAPLLEGEPEYYDGQMVLADFCHSTNFGQFIDNIIEKFPNGYYHTVIKENEGVDFMGRQENLYFDLCDALDMAGERYNEDDLLSQHVNVSLKQIDEDYTKEQKERIMEMESWVIEKYYENI